MDDGKKRLPVIKGNDSAPLLSPLSEGIKFSTGCFRAHSERELAHNYHARGLDQLHRGYWAIDEQERLRHFENSFGLFHLAIKSDGSYFCSRQALIHVSGLLGLEDLADNEEYHKTLMPEPRSNESIHGRENQGGYSCHLIHPGFYSADSLELMLSHKLS